MVNLDELLKLIPLKPMQAYYLSGIGHAIMIQFQTFHMRISHDRKGDERYLVEVYDAKNHGYPIYSDLVVPGKIQGYLRQYTSESAVAHLRSMDRREWMYQ